MPKPARRRVDVEKLGDSLGRHAERLKGIPGRREPKPGEPAETYLEEEEFEQ